MSKEIKDLLKQISELPEQDERRKELFAELCEKMDSPHLYLRNSNISDEGAKIIVSVLEKKTILTSLDLGHNNISDAGAIVIAKVLEKNTTLRSLNLESNNISVAGATAIASALERKTILTNLNLGHNDIRDAGAIVIAKVLEKNKTLTILDFYGNHISDAGAEAIAKALEKNTALTSLNLLSNNIEDVGVKHLLDALEENKNIIQIHFSWGRIERKSIRDISKALAKNKKEAEEFAEKLEDIFDPNQNQTTKYLSSSLLQDLLPRISAVSEILKQENEQTYNSLKQFLSRKLKDFSMGVSKDKESKILDNDVKREIYKSSGIDVFGDDFELKQITTEVLKIAIAIQTQSEINLYSKILEERKFPTKDNQANWQSLDIKVLKPAIKIFLDRGAQPTEKFPDLKSRVTFLKEKGIEKHPDYKEDLKPIIHGLIINSLTYLLSIRNRTESSKENEDLKQKSKVKEEVIVKRNTTDKTTSIDETASTSSSVSLHDKIKFSDELGKPDTPNTNPKTTKQKETKSLASKDSARRD